MERGRVNPIDGKTYTTPADYAELAERLTKIASASLHGVIPAQQDILAQQAEAYFATIPTLRVDMKDYLPTTPPENIEPRSNLTPFKKVGDSLRRFASRLLRTS